MTESKTAPAAVRHHVPDESLRERWAGDIEDLRGELHAADRWVRRMAHERPLLTLAGALVVRLPRRTHHLTSVKGADHGRRHSGKAPRHQREGVAPPVGAPTL